MPGDPNSAVALRDYIDAHQRYIEKIPGNAPVISYRLPVAELSANAPRTVYGSNGIALVQIAP